MPSLCEACAPMPGSTTGLNNVSGPLSRHAIHRMRGVADDRYEYQCLPEGHRAETVEIGAAGYSIANVGTSQASEEAATNTAYTPQLHHLTLTVRIRKSPHGITES